jgi:hypothetical protein
MVVSGMVNRQIAAEIGADENTVQGSSQSRGEEDAGTIPGRPDEIETKAL